jgi:hypothetical protein
MTPYQHTYRRATKLASESVRILSISTRARWCELPEKYPTVPEVTYGPCDAYVRLLSLKYGEIDPRDHIKADWTIDDLEALAQEIAVIRALEAG